MNSPNAERLGLDLLNAASFLRDDVGLIEDDRDEMQRACAFRNELARQYAALAALQARTETVTDALALILRAWNELPEPGEIFSGEGQYVEDPLARVARQFAGESARIGARLTAESPHRP